MLLDLGVGLARLQEVEVDGTGIAPVSTPSEVVAKVCRGRLDSVVA